jgi:hypothetical protein
MNRRAFSVAAMSSAALLLGCDTDQKPAHTATLLNNGEVQQAMQGLASAISGLQGAVSAFDTENWREAVPEVEGAASSVDSAFQRLRSALNVAGA